MRRILALLITTFTLISLTAQTAPLVAGNSTRKFIKGNIADKTAAVREASDSEVAWITSKAIDFCLENKAILDNDRELDGLAVAAILSVSPEVLKKSTTGAEEKLISDFTSLFLKFNRSSTVQIAVISKVVALKEYVPSEAFTIILNDYIKTTDVKTIDSGVFKATITALESIGNSESFTILYGLMNDGRYNVYKKEIENAAAVLIPNAMDEIFNLIQGADMKKLSSIFALLKKNNKISAKNLCEISEKVLIESILLTENSSGISAADLEVQLAALKVLDENKWTRASTTALSFFDLCKKMYSKGLMKEDKFGTVISCLRNIAPLNAVTPLIAYLEELNGRTEAGKQVSAEVILAVINTLGAIGDKASFDSLLAVTYLNYEESVLTAAREALSELRWQ